MAVSQTRVLIKHNVYLDIEFVSRMVRLQTLNLFDGLGETHCEVEKHIPFISSGRRASEISNVTGGGSRPIENDEERKEQTSKCIKPP